MAVKKINKEVTLKEDSLKGIDYPIFCFKHLQTCSIQDCKDHLFFFKFLERLQKLSTLGWKNIEKSEKHGFGTEKLPKEQIIPSLPIFITPEIKHLTVFRANGDNRPFLGIRRQNIFHVIFIEAKFNDIYKH